MKSSKNNLEKIGVITSNETPNDVYRENSRVSSLVADLISTGREEDQPQKAPLSLASDNRGEIRNHPEEFSTAIAYDMLPETEKSKYKDGKERFESLSEVDQKDIQEKNQRLGNLISDLVKRGNHYKERVENSIELVPTRKQRLGIDHIPKDQLWKNWKKKNPNKEAIECLKEVYGHWIEAKVIYQDDIGGKDGLDKELMKKVSNDLVNQKESAKGHPDLPEPKSVRHEKFFDSITVEVGKKINNLKQNYSRYLLKKSKG